jgi:signal transduction histidine kinase
VTANRAWLRQIAVPRSALLLPVVLAVVTQVDVWLPRPFNLGHVVGPPGVVSLLYAVTSLLLVWRRPAPVAVLVVIVTLDAVEYLAFGAPEGLGSLLPTMIAFYAVGRHARAGAFVVAAPLVLLGTAVHELKDPIFAFDGSDAVFYLVLGAAYPLGRAFRRNATQRAAIEHQSRALAFERDNRAREAAAEERARISRELHDVVGHGLTVVVLQLVAAEGLLQSGAVDIGRTKIVSAEASARSALDEMRRLLVLLGEDGADSSLAPQPGLRDLDRLLDQARAAGAQISLTIEGQAQEIPAGIDLAAYRIVQEALTNVLKHAHPPRATVRIGYELDAVTVEILDDGAPAVTTEGTGRGLTGLRERVMLYGGAIRTGPRDDAGFAVSARLPVPCR